MSHRGDPGFKNMEKEGFVYILKSMKNGSYYIGSTENIDNRFREHRAGLVKATKYLLPLEIAFYKRYEKTKEARKIE
jgi:putative endonuclease